MSTIMKPASRILLILLTVVTLSQAGPYINPGLVNIPTAYTIPHTALKIHYSGSFFLGHEPTDPNVEDYMDFSLSGGISFWGMGLELTFAALDFESDAYVGSAELNFIPETVKFPAVSIGVRNVGYEQVTSFGVTGVEGGATNYYYNYEPQWYDKVSAYVVFSKDFYPAIAVPLRGHIGLGTGIFQGIYDSIHTSSVGWQGIFGAIEYQIRYDLSVALETDGRAMNFGVLYKLPWWGMEVGLSLNKLEMLFYSDEEARNPDGTWDEYDQVDLGVHFGVQIGPFIGSSEEKKLELIRERIDRGWDQLREIQTRRQEMQQRLADMRERIAAENEGNGE